MKKIKNKQDKNNRYNDKENVWKGLCWLGVFMSKVIIHNYIQFNF